MRRALALFALLPACGAPILVHGQRSPVREAQASDNPDEIFGETVSVTVGPERYLGEVIDCDERSVFVRVHAAESSWQRLPWGDDTRVEIVQGGTGPAYLVWSLVGILSTLTHGYYAGLTSSAWGLAGSLTSSFNWNPRQPVGTCAGLHRFARFPQGMPPGFAARFGPPWPGDGPSAPATPAADPSAPWSAPAPSDAGTSP